MSLAQSSSSKDQEIIDLLVNRISQVETATSILSLLDRIELLSLLLSGMDELLQRGDTIADSISDGISEMKRISTEVNSSKTISISDLISNFSKLTISLSDQAPAISALLDSGMLNNDVVDLLSTAAGAAVEANFNSRKPGSTIKGVRALLRAMKDPEVSRGITFVVELARSLGRRM